MTYQKILVSGVSGFIGSHTTIQLLNKGYTVVGTIRNLANEQKVRDLLSEHTPNTANLTIVQADLLNSDDWITALQGIDGVLHVASPFPRTLPKNDDELVRPAKEGALNVLEAARVNNVKRVVLTSSMAAIVYGKPPENRKNTFTENDWTDETNLQDTTPYIRSKTIAEKAAWEYLKTHNNPFELVTICPSVVLGPILESDFGTSANVIIKTMDGTSPAIPNIGYEIVDVRSVADLHIRALEIDAAAHERFIASVEYKHFAQIADILRKRYPDRKIPTRLLPNFLAPIIAKFEKSIGPILVDLNTERKLSHEKAKKILGWEPISAEEAIVSCAESLIKQKVL